MKKETRQQKFQRLAQARTNRILHILQLLGNLSNKSTYDYEKKHISKIFNAIKAETQIAQERFTSIRSTLFTFEEDPEKQEKSVIKRPEVMAGKKQEVKVAQCDNCYENRSLRNYRTLWLCKRDYRKRKLIYKIRKANGHKRSFVK